ncbi:MAG: class I SAM-dependent methyltransferase [bacterium]
MMKSPCATNNIASMSKMPEGLDRCFYRKGAVLDRHQEIRLRMVRRLLKGCGGRALDYGCGYGDITHAVSPQFSDIVGVDVDEGRVQWANREFSPLSFRVCQGDRVEFPDGAFQTVISIVVINWVHSPDAYIKEAHRLLASGGALVISAAAPDRIRNLFRRITGRPPADMGCWAVSLNDMRRLLQDHGFRIDRTDCFYDPLSEDFRSWKSFLNGLGRLPARLAGSCGFAPYYGLRAIKEERMRDET